MRVWRGKAHELCGPSPPLACAFPGVPYRAPLLMQRLLYNMFRHSLACLEAPPFLPLTGRCRCEAEAVPLTSLLLHSPRVPPCSRASSGCYQARQYYAAPLVFAYVVVRPVLFLLNQLQRGCKTTALYLFKR